MTSNLYDRNISLVLSLAIFFATAAVVKCIAGIENYSLNSLDTSSNLLPNSLLYGILSQSYHNISSESDNQIILSEICKSESKSVLNGIKNEELWALKALDASGNINSGFMYGSIFWMGSRLACERINKNLWLPIMHIPDPMLINSTSPFRLNYVIIYLNYTSMRQFPPFSRSYDIPIHIGLCIPKSCSEDIFFLSQNYLSNKKSAFQKLYDINTKIIEVKTPSFERFFQRTDVEIILSLLGLITFSVIFLNIISQIIHEKSNTRKFLNCFDFKTNFNQLISTTLSPNAIGSLDGLRCIACLLIMAEHVQFFSAFAYNNLIESGIATGDWKIIILLMAVVYVDTFFVVSAFLLVNNFLKNKKQMKQIESNGLFGNAKIFGKLLLNRYIRLTPALVLTMALSHLSAVYLKENSLYYIPNEMDVYCTGPSWWHNLLYIQSYYSLDVMCGTWTWYLTADMQYFILTLFGLFIYAKNKISLSKLLFVGILLASAAYSFYLNYVEDFSFHLDVVKRTQNSLYVNPQARANPYLCGVLGGYILYKQNGKVNISKLFKIIWIITCIGFIIGIPMLIMNMNVIPVLIQQLINSLGRFYFGFLIVATIFISQSSNCTTIAKFLRHPFFTHLNKLTYMMYLIQPIIVIFYRGVNEKPIQFYWLQVYIEFFGILTITYLLSIVLVLIFEIPYSKLSTEFVMRKSSGSGVNVKNQLQNIYESNSESSREPSDSSR